MRKEIEYQKILLSQTDQEQYLLNNSCLPGPRANLELLYAFTEVSELKLVEKILNKKFAVPVANVPEEFVICCAVAASGKHILYGNKYLIPILRNLASDNRWRIRESVAMALQHLGKYNYDLLKEVIYGWEKGSLYEQRAIAAGLCEPAILNNASIKTFTFEILSEITRNLEKCNDKSSPDYKTLVQALCYCWSVAIVASPVEGKALFENLIQKKEKDIQKIVKENLKKNRLIKMDKQWVDQVSIILNK